MTAQPSKCSFGELQVKVCYLSQVSPAKTFFDIYIAYKLCFNGIFIHVAGSEGSPGFISWQELYKTVKSEILYHRYFMGL